MPRGLYKRKKVKEDHLSQVSPVSSSDSDLVRATKELESLVEQAKENDRQVEQCHDRLNANKIERDMVEKRILNELEKLRRQRRIIDSMAENAQDLVNSLNPNVRVYNNAIFGALGGCLQRK